MRIVASDMAQTVKTKLQGLLPKESFLMKEHFTGLQGFYAVLNNLLNI